MGTKFNLIKTVDAAVKQRVLDQEQLLEDAKIVRENFAAIAEQSKVEFDTLMESVTHVLANIAHAASQGVDFKAMNADSVAAFLAGVDKLSRALPTINDQQKSNALRVLKAAGIGPDGLVNTSVAPIAQLGAKDPALRGKYTEVIKQYLTTVHGKQPDGSALIAATRKLQSAIGTAMQGAVTAQPQQAAPQARPGAAPVRPGVQQQPAAPQARPRVG